MTDLQKPQLTEFEQQLADQNPEADIKRVKPGRHDRAVGMMILAIAGAVKVYRSIDRVTHSDDGFVEARRGVYVPWEMAANHDKVVGHYRTIGEEYLPEEVAHNTVKAVDGDVYFNVCELFGGDIAQEKYGDIVWVHLQKKTTDDDQGNQCSFTLMYTSSDPEALGRLKQYNADKRKNPDTAESGIHRQIFGEPLSHAAALRLSLDLRALTEAKD